jgi:hypothetical protein
MRTRNPTLAAAAALAFQRFGVVAAANDQFTVALTFVGRRASP